MCLVEPTYVEHGAHTRDGNVIGAPVRKRRGPAVRQRPNLVDHPLSDCVRSDGGMMSARAIGMSTRPGVVMLPVLLACSRLAYAAPAAEPPASSGGAKKLSNPIAALISVPLQSNFDFDGGANDDGFRYLLDIQPVIPIRAAVVTFLFPQ